MRATIFINICMIGIHIGVCVCVCVWVIGTGYFFQGISKFSLEFASDSQHSAELMIFKIRRHKIIKQNCFWRSCEGREKVTITQAVLWSTCWCGSRVFFLLQIPLLLETIFWHLWPQSSSASIEEYYSGFHFSLLKEVRDLRKVNLKLLESRKMALERKMTLPATYKNPDRLYFISESLKINYLCFFLLSVVDRFSYFLNVGGGDECLAMASYLQLEQTVDCWKIFSHWLLKIHIDLRGYLHSWFHFLFYWSLLDLQDCISFKYTTVMQCFYRLYSI